MPPAEAIRETYRKFEAMVLQNFVKSMLPADSEDVHGKGTAGEIWGMMAEQIGDVISRAGGIGIAASLMKDNQKKSARRTTLPGSTRTRSACLTGNAAAGDPAQHIRRR